MIKATPESYPLPPTKESRSAAKRDAILQAARTIFAKRGFADTMVDHIAEEAGIGKGTIYLYFESKQKIFWDIVLDDCQQMAEASKAGSIADESPWLQRIRSFIEMRLAYCEKNPNFMRILLTEVYGMILQNKPIDPRLPMLVQDAEYQLKQMFAVASAQGQIVRIDPAIPANNIVAITRGLLEQQLKGASRESVQNQLTFSLDMLASVLDPKGPKA